MVMCLPNYDKFHVVAKYDHATEIFLESIFLNDRERERSGEGKLKEQM